MNFSCADCGPVQGQLSRADGGPVSCQLSCADVGPVHIQLSCADHTPKTVCGLQMLSLCSICKISGIIYSS